METKRFEEVIAADDVLQKELEEVKGGVNAQARHTCSTGIIIEDRTNSENQR